jgi:simple sugar transport system permease protein
VTLRAAGEVPEAAASGGTSVNRLRVLVSLLTGALCGLGGASLSLGISSAFTEGMTNGRGFIALAVVVFGRWNPFGALAASLLFAAADVAQARLQTVTGVQNWLASLNLGDTYPFFLALPYVLTLVALAVRGSRVRPPAALGQPFEQG